MQTKNPQGLYIQSPKLNQLNVLREVSQNAHITQAELATRCSLSVAMVNNYMKDLCNQGFLEYNRKSVKNVSYHLTPLGIRHVENLHTELIDEMSRMYVSAKEQIRIRITNQAKSALQRVVLYGSGDLAQLVFHALEFSGINILGICDDDSKAIGRDFCGREIVNSSQIRFIAPDAVIITNNPKTDEIQRNLNPLLQHGIELIRLDTGQKISPPTLLKAGSSMSSFPYGSERKNGSLSG